MLIKNITLTNFRNYENYFLELTPLTILVGPNGSGKTNILEAIYMLATTASFRTRNHQDVVCNHQTYSHLQGSLDKDSLEIIIDLSRNQKIAKFNDLIKKPIEILGKLNVVLFIPESLAIISGSPHDRRQFINLVLSQIDKNYAQSIIELRQILNNRNHLLYRIKQGLAKEDELDFWDEKLIKLNQEIVAKRTELIDKIKPLVIDYYQEISESKSQLKIKYLPKANIDNHQDLLIKNRDQEIKFSQTIYGPHRDDLLFYLDQRPFSAGWSRGELRSAILALKMAELKFLTLIKKQSVVLLLDDVFSELDKFRKKKLLNLVKDQQTIITTTDTHGIDPKILKNAKIIEIGK